MNLQSLESELKKRLDFPYNWGRKQSDEWDRKTKFIYQTQDFESLENQCRDFDNELRNYAFNRWLNFWSAKAVEEIFASNSVQVSLEDGTEALKVALEIVRLIQK